MSSHTFSVRRLKICGLTPSSGNRMSKAFKSASEAVSTRRHKRGIQRGRTLLCLFDGVTLTAGLAAVRLSKLATAALNFVNNFSLRMISIRTNARRLLLLMECTCTLRNAGIVFSAVGEGVDLLSMCSYVVTCAAWLLRFGKTVSRVEQARQTRATIRENSH